MHWGARTAAFAAALAVSTAGMVPPVEARTEKELNVCWVNKAPGKWLDLEIVVDGPSFRTASLDHGDCIAWDVRPGQYKITVEDVDELRAGMEAACGPKKDGRLTFTIKRQQDSYTTNFRTLRQQGGIATHVRKDRRTTITAILTCVATR